MNGDDTHPNVDEFDPSWMGDGIGIQADLSTPDFSDDTQWPADARSSEQNEPEDFTGAAGDCEPPSGDTSKIYVRATHYVGGHWVCYWIETTTCP